MNEISILIVDDDLVTLTYVSKVISKKNYAYDTAVNGKVALEKLSQNRYSILLTDLGMPEMNGVELIDMVSRQFPEIVSIVMSANVDEENLLATLNENKAYSYLIKPLNALKLIEVVEKGQEHFELLQKARLFSDSEKELYENIMKTFQWKDELHSKQVTSLATEIIRQLNISFSHGSGVGSLLSVLSIFFSLSKMDAKAENYIVPKDLFAMIESNYKTTKRMLDNFSHAQTILMEEENYTEIQGLPQMLIDMEMVAKGLNAIASIKNQKISFGNFPPHAAQKEIIYKSDKMKMVFKELLINALKYSRENDKIYVMFFLKENFFEIKILNPAYQNDLGSVGIKGNDEKNVFEPFYRITAIMDDFYAEHEEFSYGLGLSIVKKILTMHNALIFVYTVKNLYMAGREEDVCVTLRFPLVER